MAQTTPAGRGRRIGKHRRMKWLDVLGLRAAQFLAWTLRRMPLGCALFFGKLLGCLGAMLDTARRQEVRDALSRAFPEISAEEIHHLARRSYRHAGLCMAEFCRIPLLTRENIDEYVDTSECEKAFRLLEQGRGLILASGHIGNWELLGAGYSLAGLPCSSIGRPLNNMLMNEWVDGIRERTGNRMLAKRGAMRMGLRALKENKVLVILMDQGAAHEGIRIPVFGKVASVRDIVASLACKFDVPVLATWIYRAPGERRHKIRMEGPVPRPSSGDPERDLYLYTAHLWALLQNAIREHPEQWSWRHRMWKEPVFKTDLVYDPAVGFYRGHPYRLVEPPPVPAGGRTPAAFDPWRGNDPRLRTERDRLAASAWDARRAARRLMSELAAGSEAAP
jgi:Kdo2-lipid IVA lauroyltransferase/acyltransferase